MTELTDSNLALIWIAALLLPLAIASRDALREMLPRRSDFLSRLALTRFYRMLDRHHIAVATYLGRTSGTRIAGHIRTCDSCACKVHCDEVLRSGELSDLSFCPSDRDMRALGR